MSAVARALSGLPFSLIDSNTDADRNAILFDFLPSGTYSGTGRNGITVDYDGKRNGAYGPGFFQIDLRLGYRISIPGGRRLDAFGEVFNLTDRANFNNPVVQVLGHPEADRRLTDFLTLTTFGPAGSPGPGKSACGSGSEATVQRQSATFSASRP